MATEYVGNAIPAPGFRKGNVSTDDELLYSTAGFTQKGVTLEAGQGVVTLGSLLSRNPATKRWVKYDNSAGDGVARGILRTSVDTGTVTRATDATVQEYQGNIVIHGIVKLSKVTADGSPIVSGGVLSAAGAAALVDLAARTDSVMDTLTF